MKMITINSSPNQVKETLKWITHFMTKYRADYDWVELARHVAKSGGAASPEQETEAVRLWVKCYADYRMDPYGVEYLQDPMVMLETQAGDCDDLSCLAGVLLINLGHDCYPAGVVWKGDRSASHCVLIDETTNLVCDPVAAVPASFWPEPPYQVEKFVKWGRA
jgi:hypothetical protein